MNTLKDITKKSPDHFWCMCEIMYYIFGKAYFYGETIKENLAGKNPSVYQIMIESHTDRFNTLIWVGLIKKITNQYKIKIGDIWIPFTLFSPINYTILSFNVHSKQLINTNQKVSIKDQLIHTSLMELRPARKLKRSLSEGDLKIPNKITNKSYSSVVSNNDKFIRLFLGHNDQTEALKFMEINCLLDCMPIGATSDAILLGSSMITGIVSSSGSKIIFTPKKGPPLILNDFDLINIRLYNFCDRCKHVPNDLRK